MQHRRWYEKMAETLMLEHVFTKIKNDENFIKFHILYYNVQ